MTQKLLTPASVIYQCMDLDLSVIKRTSEPVADVVMRLEDTGFKQVESTGNFFVMADNPERESPVKVVVGRGITGKTLILPENTASKTWLNTLGKPLDDVNIKRPAGDREQKQTVKPEDFRNDKNVVQ